MKPFFFITILSLLLFNSCFFKENIYDEDIINKIDKRWNESISDEINRRNLSEKTTIFSLYKREIVDVQFYITRQNSIEKAKEYLFQNKLGRSVSHLQEVKSTPFDKTFIQNLNLRSGKKIEIVAREKNVNIRIITNSKSHANEMIGVLVNTFEEN